VGHGGGLHHPGDLELGPPGAEVLEQPHAAAQEQGDHVYLELVEQPGPEVLLGDVRAAAHLHVPVAGRILGLLERRLDALGDEGEGGPSLLGHGLPRMVCEDEDRVVEGRVVPPPAVRVRVVLPRPLPAAEHPPPHHRGAGAAGRFLDELRVPAGLASREAVALAEGLEPECPLVEPLAALAERLIEGLVRPGDEAVQRHRDFELEHCHAH
jgi:hypothetical protein